MVKILFYMSRDNVLPLILSNTNWHFGNAKYLLVKNITYRTKHKVHCQYINEYDIICNVMPARHLTADAEFIH